MPVTRVSCPNCGQPISADVTQLFDVGENPEAKQILLSGAANLVQCPNCGYQGPLAMPIVYHDPEKEMLLTYVPPEINLPREEQERIIGPLIQQVVNRLPQEKRKGYLLQPKQSLTLQGMIEQILEADGITKEMIEAQQQKIRLIQRLLTTADDELPEVVEENPEMYDAEFFEIIARLVETSAAGGDRSTAQRLINLQRALLPITDYGRLIQEQSAEIEAAMNSLREIGAGLTRETLLDLLVEAPTETRLSALVSMTRPGLDYAFFQMLAEQIEQAQGEEKEKLAELRGKLLEITREIDLQNERHKEVARNNLETLLSVANLEATIMQNLSAIDEAFVEVLQEELEKARSAGDLERSAKLNQIMEILQKANTPPELEYIEELIQLPDAEAIIARLDQDSDKITQEFMDLLMGLMSQNQEDEQVSEKIQMIYKAALRKSMEMKMNA